MFGVVGVIGLTGIFDAFIGQKGNDLGGGVLFVLFAAVIARIALLGIKIGTQGIVVRSFVRTRRLNWDEIERFELLGTVYTPSLHIKLRSGEDIGVVGLAARTSREQSRARQIAEELNERLREEHEAMH